MYAIPPYQNKSVFLWQKFFVLCVITPRFVICESYISYLWYYGWDIICYFISQQDFVRTECWDHVFGAFLRGWLPRVMYRFIILQCYFFVALARFLLLLWRTYLSFVTKKAKYVTNLWQKRFFLFFITSWFIVLYIFLWQKCSKCSLLWSRGKNTEYRNSYKRVYRNKFVTSSHFFVV